MLPSLPGLPGTNHLRARTPTRLEPLLAALLAAFGAVALAPREAAAADKKVISSSGALGGDFTFDEFTVKTGVKVSVVAFKPGDAKATGWLRIRANKIVIEMGATIDATGAGFAGVDG